MFDPDDDRNRPFLHQLSDALSPDPAKRAATGHTFADTLSQGLANSLAGNHPGWERTFYGSGSHADQMAQDLFDDFFAQEEE